MKIYCNVRNKYRKSKILYIFQKTVFAVDIENLKCYIFKKNSCSIVYSKCGHEYEKMFKEESIDVLRILGLINDVEEYQKI